MKSNSFHNCDLEHSKHETAPKYDSQHHRLHCPHLIQSSMAFFHAALQQQHVVLVSDFFLRFGGNVTGAGPEIAAFALLLADVEGISEDGFRLQSNRIWTLSLFSGDVMCS